LDLLNFILLFENSQKFTQYIISYIN